MCEHNLQDFWSTQTLSVDERTPTTEMKELRDKILENKDVDENSKRLGIATEKHRESLLEQSRKMTMEALEYKSESKRPRSAPPSSINR